MSINATSNPPDVSLSPSFCAQFCKRHGIRKLSLFGSVTTPRFRPNSDVDVLVEFDEERLPGMFGLAAMEIELSSAIGRKADLRTAEDLSRYFRAQVVAAAVPQDERR